MSVAGMARSMGDTEPKRRATVTEGCTKEKSARKSSDDSRHGERPLFLRRSHAGILGRLLAGKAGPLNSEVLYSRVSERAVDHRQGGT